MLHSFVFLNVLSFFCFVRYRNRAVWISPWCLFCDILVLFGSFGSPMQTMFLLWLLTNELSGAHNLKASRLKCRRSCFHQKQTMFLEGSIVRKLYIFLVILTNHVVKIYVVLDVLSLFHIVPYLNLAVWIPNWCHFCDISFLFISYWDPIEVPFSSWILSSGLLCARELRASNLKLKNCCLNHLQTLSVEGHVDR